MSRVGGRFAGHAPEVELQRTVKEPVYKWKKEWVVPATLARPPTNVPGLTERLGPDAAATRSETPLKILKWVRTEEVALFPEAGME
ncbi:hypothetical protein MVES1_000106 [Malassezia vespertilionis]|uniref:uncharacterized protein n=1 Tax=Malassezia vespertilionis TaxID=2020962 RepID=UPI0024B15038|nr:uncharacterized protein MVES1_000106 [Malassezia vespertilionis]WFD04782.1 hypothetical protein MVES1_000106 [Malassezia vespertilionis]